MGKLNHIRNRDRGLKRKDSSSRNSLAAVLASLAVVFVFPANGQSATNFDTKVIAPKAKSSKKEKPAAAPAQSDAAQVSTTPSRFVGEADLEPYVAALSAVFSMKDRATDPFGQLQDPEAKRVIKTSVAKKSQRVQQMQATPFSDIIRLIKVTTIMPGERRFLVGTRSFKEGGIIPLAFRSKVINVEVMSVTSHQISLRNQESGETAALPINLLPVGMTPGNGKITAPGMTPDNPNAPIDLENGSPLEENPQNR